MKFIVENCGKGVKMYFEEVTKESDVFIYNKVSNLSTSFTFTDDYCIEDIVDSITCLICELLDKERRDEVERRRWLHIFNVIVRMKDAELEANGGDLYTILRDIESADTNESVEAIYEYLRTHVPDLEKYIEILCHTEG